MTAELINHLWQSTLFAVAVGLLTLVFRRNRAQVRYWLWFSASVKFLIPFVLLLGLGGYLGRYRAGKGVSAPAVAYAVVQVAEPFAATAPPAPARQHEANVLPIAAVSIWVCGFVGVVLMRLRSSLRIRAAVRSSLPAGIPFPVEVRSSSALWEPGVVGLFRPILLCPTWIVQHLAPSELAAVLAHELCHIRRRDNLTAALHMVVEALFWFHPLVWWISARLVEERERACDEGVLESGNDPQAYAESILKTCRACVESPLACVAGVTGADLEKRLVRIMTERSADQLGFGRKILLVASCLVTLCAPLGISFLILPPARAQTTQASSAPLPSFEVASVKPDRSGGTGAHIGYPPGRFIATNVTAKMLIEFAYEGNRAGLWLRDNQVSGGPSWLGSERYDIEAKVEDSLVEQGAERLPFDQRTALIRLMLQSLLSDRFKLKVSHTTKVLPVFALVIAKNGSRLTASTLPPLGPPGSNPPEAERPKQPSIAVGGGEITGVATSVGVLADVLSRQSELEGREVIDETGLKDTYDFTLHWIPDQSQATTFKGPSPATEGAPLPESSGPSLFTAIQEQLGLKLESRKGQVQILIIDHVERPSEN